MFYKLKVAFMKKMISKKQKNKPFDYESAENYLLDKDAPPTINNSYYFSAHSEKGQSIYCRLGLRSTFSEVWFVYFDGKKAYSCDKMIYTVNCPLSVAKEGETWRVKFNGQLTDGSSTFSAKFDGLFTSSEDAIDFFTHMPAIRTAKAMAFEKWNKNYFSEVQKNNQVHYEQTGSINGKLILNEEQIEINLPCVRDHSFGMRDWNYMNNHLWLMAVNEDSQFNFSMVSYPTMTLMEVGNFKQEKQRFLIKAEYDRNLVTESIPSDFVAEFTFDDGKKVKLKAEIENVIQYSFQDGQYLLNECLATFTIDDKKIRGIFEIGFNKEKARIFNGVEVRRLKA